MLQFDRDVLPFLFPNAFSYISLLHSPFFAVNVAGESQVLEPSGADVLGVNVPFGEYLNAGSFDTTFLDDTVRISRTKTGPVDQIRVFIKSDVADVVTRPVEDDDDELAEVQDVDAVVDPEFAAEDEDGDDSAPSDVEG